MSEGGNPSELPKGWTWATLDDLQAAEPGAMTDGPFGSNLKSSHYTESGARVIRLQNIGDGEYVDEKAFISVNHFEELRKHEVRAGDLVIASLGNELPRACLIPDLKGPAIVKADCIRMRVHPEIDNRWLLYAIIAPQTRAYAAERIRGVGRPRLGLNEIRRIPVPVPPLEEQRRIVATLEELLSRLDAATGNAANAVGTANTLIHSIKARAVRDLTDRFPVTTLGEEIREPLRNGYSARAVADGTIRTLTLTAVTKGLFDDAHTKLTAADPARISKLWLKPGDIFIQRSNTPDLVGTSALYEGPEDWAIFPDLLIRVRTSDRLDPRFAHLVLSAPQTLHYYRSQAKGLAGSMPKIDQETILGTRIPLPDLEVQRQTVQDLAQVIERAKHAAATAEAYRAKASALRRSLLAEAFAGRLVPQDPADEPAEALLDRIRAEREAAGVTKSRRRSPRRAPAQRRRTPDTAPTPDAPPPPRADAPALATATQPTLDLEIPS